MASNYDSIDLDFSWDGDFMIDSRGDLKDTSEDYLLSFKNEIFTVVKSTAGEWREALQVGAGLDDFIGEPNNRETAEALTARLKSSLTVVANLSDVYVKVIPTGVFEVLISIGVEVLSTPENNARPGDIITLSFLYNYSEKGVFVPIDELKQFGGRSI